MPDVSFGNPDQWEPFERTHYKFFERLGNLKTLLDRTFDRTLPSDASQVDQTIFIAGHLAADDFLEILILCGNNEAFAASKLLRSMFERVVLMKYLHQHPDEIERYRDYVWVEQSKLSAAIEQFHPGVIDKGSLDFVKAKADEAKTKHEYTKSGWTPMDRVRMAKEVKMHDAIVPCYYETMQQAHPNVLGMMERLEERDGRIAPISRHQPERASRTLANAHRLLLEALLIQQERFKLDEQSILNAADDYGYAWNQKPSAPIE